jgi:nucleotide-binding universal stress UspA family protein
MVCRVLLAVDGSDSSEHAVRYAGHVLAPIPDCPITLFHVLRGIPPELLEHGGRETAEAEERADEELRRQREAWLDSEREAEYPVLARAREALEQEGVAAGRIEVKLAKHLTEQSVPKQILKAARSCGCDTVVLGRHALSPLEKLFAGSVADQVVQNAEGLTVWIVQ